MLRTKGLLFTLVLALFPIISLLAGCAASANKTPSTFPSATAPATTTAAVKPQGDLIAALQSFGSENFLVFQDPKFSDCQMLVYDMLIYWDHLNHKFLPGLAESWEVSADGLTTTYHIRKGVTFSDGWGDLTSADVKYTFDTFRGPNSTGKPSVYHRFASVDAPDPYTVIVHTTDSYPTLYVDLSMANSGVSQGIICKKYLETVGLDVARKQPIGTGSYRLVDSRLGDYYKFEANDTNWRVVPEFKTITVRQMQEQSSIIAALKNHEIDLSEVAASQLADLKNAGLGVEVNPVGGSIVLMSLGGMIIPLDERYNAAIDNKDPWADQRVRKAMALAIDRQAICNSIYAGLTKPAGAPLLTLTSEKYQYPYDPATAKQLLKDAGYPDGFSFTAVSSVNPLSAEAPQVMEAVCGFWEQIGLKPKITNIDYNYYYNNNIVMRKTAGQVYITPINSIADQLTKFEQSFLPIAATVTYEDQGAYDIWNTSSKATLEERLAVTDKLNQYFYDNVGPIPVVRTSHCFAWNPATVLPWPHVESAQPLYLEYVRHAKPLNTFRLYDVWPGR